MSEPVTALKAAYLSKRSLEVLVLSEGEVADLLDLRGLLDELGEGFRALSAGEVNAPERNEIAMPDESSLLSMPGVRPGGHMTVKVVTVFEQNYDAGLPSHLATIALYDSSTGACLAFMDGTYITAIRTSASAAVSTQLLAREDAKVLTVLGAGVQGLNHLRVFPLVRDFEDIRVGSEHHEDAQALASVSKCPRGRGLRARGTELRRRRPGHTFGQPGDRAGLGAPGHARDIRGVQAASG